MIAEKVVRRAVVGIFLILLVHMLIAANDFLIPVVASLLSYLTLRPPQKWLARRGVGGGIFAAFVIVGVSVLLFVGAAWLSRPVSESVRLLPTAIRDAQSVMRSGSPGIFSEIAEAAEETREAVEEGNADETEDSKALKVEVVEKDRTVEQLVSIGPSLLGQVVLSLALLFFLLASGDLFSRKIVESFDRFEDKKRSLKLLNEAQDDLGNYLGAITLINICLGATIAVLMYLWGIPEYLVLGFLGFALNFIPYLGAIAGAAIAGLHGYGTFYDIWPALGVAATYYGATALEGQFITPYVIASRLRLNAPVVFIAVAFFAWIWSFIGMIVAIPILIVVKRLLDANPGTANIGRFLEGHRKVESSDETGSENETT